MTDGSGSDCTPKCWWCGAPLIWDCDYTHADVFGETGDEEIDGLLVSYLHCSECNATVQYCEPEPEEDDDRVQ